jgi:hypothetical protein
MRAMVIDPVRLRQRAADAMPRVLFVMIPALAGVLALFYRGRHFPEHLYFAVLFQALVFLVPDGREPDRLCGNGGGARGRAGRGRRGHCRLRRGGTAPRLWGLMAGRHTQGVGRGSRVLDALVGSRARRHDLGVRMSPDSAGVAGDPPLY